MAQARLIFPRFKIGDFLYSAINYIELKTQEILPDEELASTRDQDLHDFRKYALELFMRLTVLVFWSGTTLSSTICSKRRRATDTFLAGRKNPLVCLIYKT